MNIVTDAVAGIEVPQLLTHEVIAHKGIRAIFGDAELNRFLDALWSDERHRALIQQSADAYGLDTTKESERREATEEWLGAIVDTNEKPGGWEQVLLQTKLYLSNIPLFRHQRFSDREIETFFALSARALRRQGMLSGASRTGGKKIRMAAALRRPNAPNTAGRPGKLVVGTMNHAPGFLEWAGLSGKGIYVDGELLLGRHPEYFANQAEAVAAVEFVLAGPEKAKDVSGNMAFVRKDEESGKIFRIEIQKKARGSRNHVRSAHEITEEQYEKGKVGEDFPVLQLSQTEFQKEQNARSYSDLVKEYNLKYPNVKSDFEEKSKKSRFALTPSEERRQKSRRRRDETLHGISEEALLTHLEKMLSKPTYSWKSESERLEMLSGAQNFFHRFSKKEIPLSDGRIVYFVPDERAFQRLDAADAWAEYCLHAVTSEAKTEGNKIRKYSEKKTENIHRIEDVIRGERAFPRLYDNAPENDSINFVGDIGNGYWLEVATRADEYGNINADLREVTTITTSTHKPTQWSYTRSIETVVRHQIKIESRTTGTPSTVDTLQQDARNVNPDFEETSKNLRPSDDDIAVEEHIRFSLDPSERRKRSREILQSPSPEERKQIQFEIIQQYNPMRDDYHVGIRSPEEIKTFQEAIEDPESFVWGDYSRADAERDLKRGTVTVYSSHPIRQGTFVSTSRNMARDYGAGKIFMRTVSPDRVAWINGDEGMFASLEDLDFDEALNELRFSIDDAGTGPDPEARHDVMWGAEHYSEQEKEDIVTVLQPYMGTVMQEEMETYQAQLKKHGIDVPLEDMLGFAQEALYRNQKLHAEHRRRVAYEEFARENPQLASLASRLERGERIIPSEKYASEDFSKGDFVHDAYRKFPASKGEALTGKRRETWEAQRAEALACMRAAQFFRISSASRARAAARSAVPRLTVVRTRRRDPSGMVFTVRK